MGLLGRFRVPPALLQALWHPDLTSGTCGSELTYGRPFHHSGPQSSCSICLPSSHPTHADPPIYDRSAGLGAHVHVVYKCRTQSEHLPPLYSCSAYTLGACPPHPPRALRSAFFCACRTRDAAPACTICLLSACSLCHTASSLSSCAPARSPAPVWSAPARNWLN